MPLGLKIKPKCDMKFSVRNIIIPVSWITFAVLMNLFGSINMRSAGGFRSSLRKGSGHPKDFTPPLREYHADSMAAFDLGIIRNVTTQRGQTGFLHCIVNNIEDKTVSWIRRRDFHVLTVGLDTYTTENRFETSYVPSTNDWVLKISYAQVQDSGIYECQVSSDPKISFFVNLNVVVAKADIIGSPDLYIREGSSINLTCVISLSPEPPLFVFWYHDNRMINYDVSRVEINVQKGGEDTTISRLFVRSAGVENSGNYTCCPSNTDATSILVHVLLDEKQEAIQHDSGHTGTSSKSGCSVVVPLLFLWFTFHMRYRR